MAFRKKKQDPFHEIQACLQRRDYKSALDWFNTLLQKDPKNTQVRLRFADTLVLVMGEFGRTPQINKDAGRDHWPYCFSLLIGGAGIPGGRTFGASDEHAAYPTSTPVTAGQLAATVFHALGIEPGLTLSTFDGRPYKICEDPPALGLWG